MSRTTFGIKKRKRYHKYDYTRSFNSDIIAWSLLAALAIVVLSIRFFGW